MRIKRLTATILVFVMLAITCCGLFLSCSDETQTGDGEYTITFNANGGTVNPSSAQTVDGRLVSFPTPVKENTEFLGWYLSSKFSGNRLTVNHKFTFSCLVHAKWGETQKSEYTVSFDPNGGKLAADTEKMETVNGRLLALPVDPTPPQNSTFIGWYTEKTDGVEIDTNYEFTGETKEVTVYAHYFREYLISFDAGAGYVSERSRVTSNGKLLGSLPIPTRVPTDTTFVGWYTQKTGGKRVKSTTVFDSNCTIYARYLEDGEYIITLDANGGSLADGIDEMFTVDAKLSEMPKPPTPSRGYEFVGWFTKKTGGSPVNTEMVFTDSDTIYAQYILVEFWVSFDANGGRLSESTSIMTVDKKLERLPYRPFAPSGKRFIGWYTERDGGIKVDTNYEFPGTPSTVKLYAHYDTAIVRGDGLWSEDIQDKVSKGEFKNPANGEVWAYDISIQAGVPLEIWYNGELITNVTRDAQSTSKIALSPDKMLRLVDGADISNSIINVLYKFSSKIIYIQEVVRAEIKANDGIYIGKTKKHSLSQNIASAEVMAENVVIASGGTTELTVVFGGKTVEIANFGKEDAVKAQLAADKKNVIIAAGTYSIYYNYGATDTTSGDYRKLWITGRSTGDLPQINDPTNDSPYYMVGSSATLGLKWETIETVSLIPENIHLKKSGNNTYSVTVDLYAGNQFKILKVGDKWEGAYNYQSLDGNTGSKKYFDNSNDLDGKSDFNIVVRTAGNYTLTINTATSRLTFVRNGEAADVKITYDIYIHGSFTSAWESRKAASNNTAGTVTFEYTLTAGLEFGIKTTPYNQSNQIGWAAYAQVVANNTNGGIARASKDNNLTCRKAGTYRFTLTLDSSGQISSIKIDTVV